MKEPILLALLAPPLLLLLYVLSAGPVLHYSFGGGSFAAVYGFYEPVLALDPTKLLGRVLWAYMRLWFAARKRKPDQIRPAMKRFREAYAEVKNVTSPSAR